MAGADQAGVLAALMQDPAIRAEIEQVQLDTSAGMQEAQSKGQLEMLKAANQGRVDLLKALVKVRQDREKQQAQVAAKQPAPGQAQSALVRGTMRGAGTEFPKIDTRKPLSQGRTDASGTGAESGIMSTIDKLAAMGIGPGGAAARLGRGGAAAQSRGPVAGIRGPGGAPGAVRAATGGPPVPPQPSAPGGGGAPPPVNIGGQQYTAPAHIVTTQRERGYHYAPSGLGTFQPVPFNTTTQTVIPNVLTARDMADLAMARQQMMMESAETTSRDTGAPRSVTLPAYKAAWDGDLATFDRLLGPWPSASHQLLVDQAAHERAGTRAQNAMADKYLGEARLDNLLYRYTRRQINARLRLGPRYDAQDYAGIAGIRGLPPSPMAGLGGEVGGLGAMLGLGGGKGAITEGQYANYRRLNRDRLFLLDDEGEPVGPRDLGMPLRIETGLALRDDGQLLYFDENDQPTYVPIELVKAQIEQFELAQTDAESDEARLALEQYPFIDIVRQTDPDGAEYDVIEAVPDDEGYNREAGRAMFNILQYWKEMPNEMQVGPPPVSQVPTEPGVAAPSGLGMSPRPTGPGTLAGTNIPFDPGAAARARFGLGPPEPADVAAANVAAQYGWPAGKYALEAWGAAKLLKPVGAALESRAGKKVGEAIRKRARIKPIERPAPTPQFIPGAGPPRPPYFRPPLPPRQPPVRPGAYIQVPRPTTSGLREGFGPPPRPTGTPPWLSGSLESRAAAEAREQARRRARAALEKARKAKAAKKKP
jgi:hypothetical protein